jgi:4-azaleucine resistance transporter AzlC
MTALFLVICVEQWKSAQSHLPALMSAGVTVVSLLLFGAKNMLFPAMIGIIAGLTLTRPYLQRRLIIKNEEGQRG